MKDDVISLDKFQGINEINSLLQHAIENEVNEYLESMKSRRSSERRKQPVRNGSLPERELQTGMGPISVQPRVRNQEG